MPEPLSIVPTKGPDSRTKSGCGGCLVWLLVAALAVSFFFRRCSYPPDMVKVTVTSLPAGAKSFYVVAEGVKGVFRLRQYFQFHPLGGPERLEFEHEDRLHLLGREPIVRNIEWPSAKRYGVLVQSRDGKWRLFWMTNESLSGPSVLRHLFGGGEAEMRLPEGSKGEVVSPTLLKQLGLPHASNRPAPVIPR